MNNTQNDNQLRTANMYLGDPGASPIVYGFASEAGAPVLLEVENPGGEAGVTLTRDQWAAFKASVDAAWPTSITANDLS